MTKTELIKRYHEIVLKTNGGNDDYVVALLQIMDAIRELDDPADKEPCEFCAEYTDIYYFAKWLGTIDGDMVWNEKTKKQKARYCPACGKRLGGEK
jgi:hypothetical protein